MSAQKRVVLTMSCHVTQIAPQINGAFNIRQRGVWIVNLSTKIRNNFNGLCTLARKTNPRIREPTDDLTVLSFGVSFCQGC